MISSSLRRCFAALLLGTALLAPAMAQTVLELPAAQGSGADLRLALTLPAGGAMRLERLPLGMQGPETVSADLRRINTDASAPLLVVHSGSNVTTMRPPPRAHFSGQLVGVPDSNVFVSIDSQGAMRGIVRRGDEVFITDMVAPGGASAAGTAKQSASALRSRKVDFSADAPSRPFACGVDDDLIKKHYVEPSTTFLEKLRDNHQRAGTSGVAAKGVEALGAQRRADLIIETDYELYQILGSADAVYAYAIDLLGFASSQYQSEIGARLNLTEIHAYTNNAADPWSTSTDSIELLGELQTRWNAASRANQIRHHVHLLAGRETGGGVSYVGTLGSSSRHNAYGLSGSLSGTFSASNPQVIWDSLQVAHEIGHAFGSTHTHQFDNPPYGSSQGGAIDCCVSQVAGQCANLLGGVGRLGMLPGTGSISGGTPATGAGTIMSYCHLQSPGASNISYNFGTNHNRGVNAWRVASVLQSSAQTYLPVDSVAQNYTLSVSRQGTGTGSVGSSPAGIDCGSTCSGSFAGNSTVTLTAQAAPGSTFAGWGGSCTGTSSSCTVSMAGARSVTATFNQASNTRTVSVTKSGNGSGSITSSPSGLTCGTSCTSAMANFATSSAVALTAQAANGSTFGGWSGACNGSGSCTIPAGTSNSNVSATFNTSGGTGGTGGKVTLLNQSNLSGATGSTAGFSVQVPAGATNLVVSTSGGTGDLDLYVRAGAAPTQQTHDCSSTQVGNSGSCGVATPTPGTYYIVLHGYAGYSGASLRVAYSTPPSKVTLNVSKTGPGQGTVSSISSVSAQLPTNAIQADTKIVGGTAAQPGAWPWQVRLSITTSQGSFICGGSLIAEQWVATAAHCIDNDGVTVSPASVTVRAGSLKKDSGGVVVGVSEIIKHHAYEPATTDNDIALLHLSSPLPLSSTINVVAPLSASQENQLAATNMPAIVTGWGSTSEGGSTSSDLLQAQVLLLSSSDCRTQSAYDASVLTNNMICAGLPSGGRDSCQGDSGGPLVVPNGNGGYVLTGVVSWGNGCGRPNYPGIYTRVANYQPWLQKHTQLALGAPLINCGSACSATVDTGTTITLRASASMGSTFTGWSGACSGTSVTCTVQLDSARNVTANFSGSSNAYTQQVVTMFTGYFGRPASPNGQSYYEGLMAQSGGNYRILVDDFYKSAESQAIYGGLGVSAQVTQVFRQLFSRDPQPSGLTYWTQQVNQGVISVPEIAYTVAYNAADADSTILGAKQRAALEFTKALATNTQYANAYSQRQALGRAYLSCVNGNAAADAAIAKLPTTMANMAAGGTSYTCP